MGQQVVVAMLYLRYVKSRSRSTDERMSQSANHGYLYDAAIIEIKNFVCFFVKLLCSSLAVAVHLRSSDGTRR